MGHGGPKAGCERKYILKKGNQCLQDRDKGEPGLRKHRDGEGSTEGSSCLTALMSGMFMMASPVG